MTQSTLITAAVFLFIVVRFLMRELRERHLSRAQLFVLPVIIWAVALVSVGVVATSSPAAVPELVLEIGIAIVMGLLIGFAVAHFTTVRTAADGRIFFRGSYATVGIWIVALLLRVGARFAIVSSGPKGAAVAANAALIVLLATALTAMRVLVRRKAISERARGGSLSESAF